MPTALEKHIKRLTNALIISGTINISLFATFLYLVLKDKHTPVAIELKPAPANPSASPSADQVLRSYFSLSFPDLLLKLENKDHVEDGLTSRDLSLACLITFHHFNLERALGSLPLQKREIIFHHSDEQVDLAVYPGLADTQFDAILHYAKTEKWPLTNQGLFFEIQRSSHPRDPSLLEAFTLTPELHTVFTLFHKTNLPLEKETLITLLA